MAILDLGRVRGVDGVGVPTGGSTGQILGKASDNDYDTKWLNPPQACKENLLDNSDFEIAQTGYNGSHGTVPYHADRWFGNGTGTLSVQDGVKTFTSVSGYSWMGQKLWDDGRDHGKTYTFVVTLPDGSRLACSGTSPSEPMTSELVFADMYMPDRSCAFNLMKNEDNSLMVRFDAPQSGASVSFLHADLYEGEYTAENAPPHVPKGYTVEMTECRNYFRLISNACFLPYHKSESMRFYRYVFEMPMRRNAYPSVKIIEAEERDGTTWLGTGAAISISGRDEYSITVLAEGSSGDTENFFMNFTAYLSSDLP